VIIMTSNVGSGAIRKQRLGFAGEEEQGEHEGLEKRLLEELRKSFRPEFLNRVDEIIVFDPLTREQLAEIVDLLLTHMRELMKGQGLALEVSDAARAHIAEEGYDAEYGARPLKRAIQRLVENPLSSALLRGEFHEGDTVKVDVAGGSLVFTK
jgi:ATP-dependent Clp protease ATP-binding subunit ClpA